MDRAVLIRRRAMAQQQQRELLAQLAARFALPEDFAIEPARYPTADPETRGLLQLEAQVQALRVLMAAPIREDANERLGALPPPAPPIPFPPASPRAPLQIREAPPVRPVRVLSGFGYPENDGPPVLHAIGRVNFDVYGNDHSSPVEEAETNRLNVQDAFTRLQEHIVAQDRESTLRGGTPVAHPAPEETSRQIAEAHAAIQRGIHERSKAEAAKLDVETLPTAGFKDNPGPPVLRIDPNLTPEDRATMERQHQERTAQANERLAEIHAQQRDQALADLENEDSEVDSPHEVPPVPSVAESHEGLDEELIAQHEAAQAKRFAQEQDRAERPPTPQQTPELPPVPSPAVVPVTQPVSVGPAPAVDSAESQQADVPTEPPPPPESAPPPEQPAETTVTPEDQAPVQEALEAVPPEAESVTVATSESNSSAQQEGTENLTDAGITDRQAEVLAEHGFTTKAKIREASDERLTTIPGIGPATVRHLREWAAGA